MHRNALTRWVSLAAVGLGVIVAGLIINIQDQVRLTEGIDAYEFHRPVFGKHIQSQDITLDNPIEGVGVILVNLRRAAVISDATLTISVPDTDEIIGIFNIPSSHIQDDEYATVLFPGPVGSSGQRLRLALSAPDATATNPLAVRFHPDDVYREGRSWTNTTATSGDLAVLLVERVPVWHYAIRNIAEHSVVVWQWAAVVTAALAIAGLGLADRRWQHWPKRRRLAIEWAIIAIIALLGMGARLATLPAFHGVSGGDPYNYLTITQQLVKGESPFAGQKRLPGYPLLLIPAYLTDIDDQWWMRLIAIVSAAGVTVSLPLLARQLGLPWSVQIASAAVITFQKDFWWNSFRPEPYTLYAFLLVLSLAMFVRFRASWQVYLCGILLGYAAMTRQEGFVLAFILGMAALIGGRYFDSPLAENKQRTQAGNRAVAWAQHRLRYWRLVVPALLLVLPFFIHNTISYGNPLFTPYFEGERLQIVDSWPAFVDSAGATWGVLGSMWSSHWDQLQRLSFGDPLFIFVIVTGITGWLLWQYPRVMHNRWWLWCNLAAGTACMLLLGWWYIDARGALMQKILVITGALGVVSPLPFLWATRGRGVVVWLVLLSQILIATWFHPFPKHYQQAYPLLVLMLITMLTLGRENVAEYALKTPKLRLAAVWVLRAAVLVPLGLVIVLLQTRQAVEIDQYNNGTALDHVLYQAVQSAADLPRPLGFDQAYLQARVYYEDDDQAHYYDGGEESTPDQEADWLRRLGIKTLVMTTDTETFSQPTADWQLLTSFRTEGKQERLFESRIYAIP